MSNKAYELYLKDRQSQQSRNEARHIRTRVTEARRSRHAAGMRWPFELLQNALDAGPRPGRETVTVSLSCKSDSLVFEHDGAPFTSAELAALLSGGSSKEFESEKTTGRFGAGFLVTHVLAETTRLCGLLAVETGHERFELTLDRSGDEKAILDNINSCNEAIRAAILVDNVDSEPSARFTYPRDDSDTLLAGVEAFRRSLPYLYGTRPLLGRVRIALPDGGEEYWQPCTPVEHLSDGRLIVERVIERTLPAAGTAGMHQERLRIVRLHVDTEVSSAALVVLKADGTTWCVLVPDAEWPRIYREYPVRGSSFLPVNIVLDGKYEVDQERYRVLLSDRDKSLLEKAFDAAVTAVSVGLQQGWQDVHRLAHVSKCESGFDPSNAAETSWWKGQLAHLAEQMARLPVVVTTKGYLPAIGGSGDTAAFPIPRLHFGDKADGTTIERILPLARASTALCPPLDAVAGEWVEISQGWSALGVAVNRADLTKLASYVRGKAKAFDDLAVEGDKVAWLAQFLDVVGECWQAREGVDLAVLDGILPNQKGMLASPRDLRRDAGVPEELKDICARLGIDLRGQLLPTDLSEKASALRLTFLPDVLSKCLPREQTEAQTVEECVKKLEADLPEGSRELDERAQAIGGSICLLDYLCRSCGAEGRDLAVRVPLVVNDKSITKWSRDRMLMAPVSCWHEKARPFAVAYPPDRVLHDMYGDTAASSSPNVVQALCDWDIAYADPLCTGLRVELKERELAAIVVHPDEAQGVTVTGQELSQIALLEPHVRNRCQEDPEKASALLGLVLCYIAPTDTGWRTQIEVTGRKARADTRLTIWGALWLADLKCKSWVPVSSDDGGHNKMLASAATLKEIVKPEWLAGNDAAVELLSTHFGFDQLELRLMGIAPDQAQRSRLRDGLAKLVEFAGADPALYEALAEEVQERHRRSREVQRCRKLGLAVQEAVRRALESRGLNLQLVDLGFDYEVTVPTAPGEPMTDGAYGLSVGPYLLEIKATTSGEVRLTPTQASVASEQTDRYALCVVDLRGVVPERLDEEWTAGDVEPIAQIVADIGGSVRETRVLVSAAAAKPVGIRNETALRYEVPELVWGTGCTITDWVARIGGPAPPRAVPQFDDTGASDTKGERPSIEECRK